MKRVTIYSWAITAALTAVSLGVFGNQEYSTISGDLPDLIVTPEQSTAWIMGDAIFEEFWGDDRPTYVTSETVTTPNRM
jgi:hypothetical protein